MTPHGTVGHKGAKGRNHKGWWSSSCGLCPLSWGMYDGFVLEPRKIAFWALAQHLLDLHGIFEPAIEMVE